MNINVNWDSYWAARQEREIIRCPHCKEALINEDGSYPVSYFGDEGDPTEVECYQCDQKYYVKENVERTYEAFKTLEEC